VSAGADDEWLAWAGNPCSHAFMRIGGALALVAGLLAAGGCKQRCDPPRETTYSCQPLPAGSTGCQGGPAFGSPTGGPRDPDKVFPLGCAVQIPFCLFDAPTAVQTCSCREGKSSPDAGTDGGAGPSWVCAV
jgi:hypothetical protein